jgi:membrane fusion protein (multidrug efflux system)
VTAQPEHPPAEPAPHPPAATPPPPAARPAAHHLRRWLLLALVVAGLATAGYLLMPWLETALNTVSTDDAYVNGHYTTVAPRVAGQVVEVLVDDNYRVKKGDVLVRLDREPYQVQVDIKKAAVEVAQRNLVAAEAQVRGLAAKTRSQRYKLDHAIEDVNNQIANLQAAVATLNSRKATLDLALSNLKRGQELFPTGISKEELDQRRQTVKVDEAAVEQALQQVYAIRVGLGLPAQPGKGHDLGETPPDLDQNFSLVRQTLADVLQSAAQLGYFPTSWDASPKQAQRDFYKQDAQGNLDRIYEHLIKEAPAVKQAQAQVQQARADLENAELNLRYCDVISDIDGVVTSRNVNPGNNVQVGQGLMAVHSLTEVWVDANFKETQLEPLRIGQQVRLEVDMYGGRREFKGYISGFTYGTGQTLALLPPQNATGNFVKIVQRLPVRIELLDYDPEVAPLFAGLSVVPYVYYKRPLVDRDIPGKGQRLQPLTPLPKGPQPSP